MTTTIYSTEITYDRYTHLYEMFLNGQSIGHAPTHDDAKATLNELIAHLLNGTPATDLDFAEQRAGLELLAPCGACAGTHPIQSCPEVAARVLAAYLCPSCGDPMSAPGLCAACIETGEADDPAIPTVYEPRVLARLWQQNRPGLVAALRCLNEAQFERQVRAHALWLSHYCPGAAPEDIATAWRRMMAGADHHASAAPGTTVLIRA